MDPKINAAGDGSRPAYDLIAEHYDGFTAHHDYESWFESLLPALRARGLEGDRLLDAGCGTGKSSLPMLSRGWRVTACDHSPRMLERLREKAGDRIDTEEVDLRNAPLLGEFDLIISLGDVLNYCAASGSLTPVFEGLRRNLAPGGLLLFDLNTVTTYRTFYAETIETTVEDRPVRWRGQGDGTATPGGTATSVMEVPGPGGATESAVHRQRHVPRDETITSLSEAGLRPLDVFGQGFDAVLERPLEEDRHTKAVYIAGHANQEEGR